MTAARALIRGASILTMDAAIGDVGKGYILIEGEHCCGGTLD